MTSKVVTLLPIAFNNQFGKTEPQCCGLTNNDVTPHGRNAISPQLRYLDQEKKQGHNTMISEPETYYIAKPTPHVPNSPLPVLVYRSALPTNPTAESVRGAIEQNNWLQGGVFKHYPRHQFHSVTHECYAVFKGGSRLLLGRSVNYTSDAMCLS